MLIDKKSNRILVVLSNAFPYGKGESFLEEEVHYYKNFDQIYMVPLNVSDFSQKRVMNNPNVTLLQLNDKSLSKMQLLGWCIRAAFSKQFCSDFSHLIHIKKLNPATLKHLVTFVALGKHSFAQVKSALKTQMVNKSDFITFYSYWMDFHSYAAVLLKNYFPQSKAVSRCHGYDLYEYRNLQNYIPMRSYLLSNLDTVFCISEDGKKYLEEKHADVQKHIVISRLGTHDYGESDAPQEKASLQLVSCSWVSSVKRINRILSTLMQIKDIQIEWTHFGDGVLFEDLKKSAEQLPTNIKVHLPGAVSNEELLRIYHTTPYHVFLNVSESEGVPVSIMEAMSFGIPAIATDVGGVSEIVKDQKNGFLLRKDFTDSELAERIHRFSEMSNADYMAYRKCARDFWEENFNAEKNYSSFTEAIV
ncbi:MAG TPA: glycosyltransferase [Oscillospiraceae bacterium]|nr:glycosyltransferase [Oscillospiraceae bacterium]